MLNQNSLTTQPLTSAMQQADAMSLSLLFSLGRYYLDLPLNQSNNLWQINQGKDNIATAHFLKLEQVGNPVGNITQNPLTALQNALSACHATCQYYLIFVI